MICCGFQKSKQLSKKLNLILKMITIMRRNYTASSPWWKLILECPGLKMNSLPLASLVAKMVKNLPVRGWDVSREQHVYYLGWHRSPAQVGCMRQVLGPGALGRPRGIGWRGRWEGGSGWGIHVTPWLIHVSVWQNPLQCCEVISHQLIKINEKKKNLPVIQETQVPSLGQGDPLQKGMATHSSLLAWRIP